LRPLLDTAATKASYGSNLPQSAHRIYAAQNMFDALKTYDPSKGALQTHIYNAVHQKAKRLNYLYQNLGKITEPRAMMVGSYSNELANAREELGREPSAAEMADRLGKSLRDIELIQKEIQKDLSSAGLEEEIITESPREAEILSYLYFELSNEQKVIYDYVFGKHGKPRLTKANNRIDFDGIASRVGFSASKVRMLWAQIRAKYDKPAK
jgi:DNA-directed RNA polymerase specialized sigma subunit